MDTFNQLTNTAKVWVYAANKALTNKQVEGIQTMLDSFATSWTSHQMPLLAKAAVVYQTFLVFMVDENQNAISGCGIDKSVALVKEIGLKYEIDFFNRLNLQFINNNEINIIGSSQIRDAIAKGALTPESVVFNNLVQTKEEFEKNWKITLEKSWASKYLSQTV